MHLIDFGVSKQFAGNSKLIGSPGTIAFASPESLSGEEYDAYQSDVWSFGVLLYCCIFGELPFQDSEESDMMNEIATKV